MKNGRLKWANKPFYANLIIIFKLTFFRKHPVDVVKTSDAGDEEGSFFPKPF